MFDTVNAPCPAGAEDDVRVGGLGDSVIDPVIVKARRLQALVRQRSAFFSEPVMADDAMAAMARLFLAQCEGRPVTREALICAESVRGGGPDEAPDQVIASLLSAGLVRADAGRKGGPAGGDDVIALTPMGSSRMRSYLGDLPCA